jgi:hypothetical protein
MTKMRITVTAIALALTLGIEPSHAACRRAGGLATMPTEALSKFMAEAALKNAIANHGWKAAGPISMSCKDEGLVTTCTARRRACD